MISRKTAGSAALGNGPGFSRISASIEVALPRRAVDEVAPSRLEAAHRFDPLRAAVERGEDLAIHRVDALA